MFWNMKGQTKPSWTCKMSRVVTLFLLFREKRYFKLLTCLFRFVRFSDCFEGNAALFNRPVSDSSQVLTIIKLLFLLLNIYSRRKERKGWPITGFYSYCPVSPRLFLATSYFSSFLLFPYFYMYGDLKRKYNG